MEMSMNSEFLLIAGADWHELLNITPVIDSYGENAFYDIVNARSQYPVMDGYLEGKGYIPENNGITNAFMINTGGPYESRLRLWVQYSPLVYEV